MQVNVSEMRASVSAPDFGFAEAMSLNSRESSYAFKMASLCNRDAPPEYHGLAFCWNHRSNCPAPFHDARFDIPPAACRIAAGTGFQPDAFR
jgi:hypothetical protein